MKTRIVRLIGLFVVVLALATPGPALAHPLGNFTVNRYSRIEPAGDGVRISYVLDLAEIPTFQEQARIDADRDGQVTDVERDRYAEARAEELRRNLHLTIDGAHLMISEAAGPFEVLGAAVNLYVRDVEETFRRAVAAGATPVMEPSDRFYGDRNAVVKDPAGIVWSLATHIEELR